jgi:hypothetical protein
MPTILTEATVKAGRPKASGDLDHAFCVKDPDVSLCGLDISDMPVLDGPPNWDHVCVVCADLCVVACPICGADD